MKTVNKFKPCPFCGGEVEVFGINNGNPFMVYCESCGLEFGREKDFHFYQVLEAWNRRVDGGQMDGCSNEKAGLKAELDAAVAGLNYLCGYRPNADFKPSICGVCRYAKGCNRKCFVNVPGGSNLWEWAGTEKE
ncbi:MAG TPA: hypothetical protein GX523_10790 [Desulfitobacterium dehalogenans]|uniref:Restriction alleviation protein, Lar family n=1 Tax=Desulfitobacterium dehalogenans TaxID=36854 RepID=A0A7C6Z511_9FIRM|nr:hypothetical protein [Desulfitobacterium dehalogenans]